MFQKSLLGGALLVTGVCVGGGMLGLPILTSTAGFYPSLLVFFLTWLLMMFTGFLFLEACLWFKGGVNMITMTEKTVGPWAKHLCWLVYLFLFYSLTLAYVDGGAQIISYLTGISYYQGIAFFAAALAFTAFTPVRFVDLLNIVLMIGLVVSYGVLLGLGSSEVVVDRLSQQMSWPHALQIFPVCFAAFGYQGLIPTLCSHFDYDRKKIMGSIVLGTFFSFVIYLSWQFFVMGIVPFEGPSGLQQALIEGQTSIYPLSGSLKNSSLIFLGNLFGLFALVTSFIGVALSLRDFLADGLTIEKNILGRIKLVLLILCPVMLILFNYPAIFLVALEYAGGFGGAFILALLPIMIIYWGRSKFGANAEFKVWGGNKLLLTLAAFIVFEIAMEVLKLYSRLVH